MTEVCPKPHNVLHDGHVMRLEEVVDNRERWRCVGCGHERIKPAVRPTPPPNAPVRRDSDAARQMQADYKAAQRSEGDPPATVVGLVSEENARALSALGLGEPGPGALGFRLNEPGGRGRFSQPAPPPPTTYEQLGEDDTKVAMAFLVNHYDRSGEPVEAQLERWDGWARWAVAVLDLGLERQEENKRRNDGPNKN